MEKEYTKISTGMKEHTSIKELEKYIYSPQKKRKRGILSKKEEKIKELIEEQKKENKEFVNDILASLEYNKLMRTSVLLAINNKLYQSEEDLETYQTYPERKYLHISTLFDINVFVLHKLAEKYGEQQSVLNEFFEGKLL